MLFSGNATAFLYCLLLKCDTAGWLVVAVDDEKVSLLRYSAALDDLFAKIFGNVDDCAVDSLPPSPHIHSLIITRLNV